MYIIEWLKRLSPKYRNNHIDPDVREAIKNIVEPIIKEELYRRQLMRKMGNNTPLNKLGVSTRACNALIKYLRIKTKNDLIRYVEDYGVSALYDVRNIGESAMEELRSVLSYKE